MDVHVVLLSLVIGRSFLSESTKTDQTALRHWKCGALHSPLSQIAPVTAVNFMIELIFTASHKSNPSSSSSSNIL